MENPRTDRISIAGETVAAHGINPDSVLAVFDPVFTKRNEVYPTPDGDAYLSVAGLVASERGGTTITAETPPGYVDHMLEVGVLPSDTRVLQRPITIEHPDKVGHPASDPLALMVREGVRLDENGRPYYVSIFESPDVREEAERAGLELLGRPDSTLTNNKARLRQFAEEYGIDMLPGRVVESWEELHKFADRHKGEKAWMKVSIGSGGDLVLPVRHLSREAADEATRRMRQTVSQAFDRADFSMTVDEFWPEGDVSPVGFPNVIEEDAGVEGEIEINGSNFFITKKDGSVEYLGTFQQITSPDGEFMGSRLYHPEPDVMEKILDQTQRFAQFNMNENGYFGIQGMDFFVMRDGLGNPRVRPIEGNSRPPISSYPEILMRNLRTEHDGYDSPDGTWDNINLVSTQMPLDAVTRVPDIIGAGLAFGHRDRHGNVLRQAIPLAVRALVHKNGHGEEPAVIPSDRMKMFVYGANEEQKALAFTELESRGVVYRA